MKNLYSLMLSEDVVRAVDAMAHRMGTNRSALVNQILAEALSVTTPEQRIQEIFRTIETLVAPEQELVPFFDPNSPTLSLKSSLSYKYRPTIKYEVELDRSGRGMLGELSVIFRTQSAELIAALTEFFRMWVRIEDSWLAPELEERTPWALYDGRFVRPIAMPRQECTADEIATAISEYVQLLDRSLKGYLNGDLTPRQVEQTYCDSLRNRTLLV